MKKLFILTVTTLITSTTFANSSISLGYAQGSIKEGDKVRGVNAKYTYEINDKIGVLTSLTYLKGSKKEVDKSITTNSFIDESQTKYTSLSIGPIYRINDYISLYGTLGVAKTNTKLSEKSEFPNKQIVVDRESKSSKTALAYSVGTQVNVTSNFLVNVGYEGSKVNNGETNKKLNSFVIGLGYKF